MAEPAPAPPDAAPEGPALPHHSYATASEALATVLAKRPRVLGIGEAHERTDTKPVLSALRRFRTELVGDVLETTSDLIMEIWARDNCGAKGAKINADVQKATQRPATTENDVVALMTLTKKSGVYNHVLRMTCDDYDSIVDAKKEVDYEKLLVLVTKKLYETTANVVTHRDKTAKPGEKRRLVIVYGGALHNDRYPRPGTEDLSYGPALAKLIGDGYIELDLFVPELVAGDKRFEKRDWYPTFAETVSPEHVVLIERGKGSYILILKSERLKPK